MCGRGEAEVGPAGELTERSGEREECADNGEGGT